MPGDEPNIPTLDQLDQDGDTAAGGGTTPATTDPVNPSPGVDPKDPFGGSGNDDLNVEVVDIGDVSATTEEVVQAVQLRAAVKTIERLENVPKTLSQKRSYAKALSVVAMLAPDQIARAEALIAQFD